MLDMSGASQRARQAKELTTGANSPEVLYVSPMSPMTAITMGESSPTGACVLKVYSFVLRSR